MKKWDLTGTATSALEGIGYGAIDKVLMDQDALATPVPRTEPFKTWSDGWRVATAIVSAGVEAAMPKYADYAKPITGASFAFLAQSVWAFANSRSAGNRVTYTPQATGATAAARAAAARAAAARAAGHPGYAQQGVRNDEIIA